MGPRQGILVLAGAALLTGGYAQEQTIPPSAFTVNFDGSRGRTPVPATTPAAAPSPTPVTSAEPAQGSGSSTGAIVGGVVGGVVGLLALAALLAFFLLRRRRRRGRGPLDTASQAEEGKGLEGAPTKSAAFHDTAPTSQVASMFPNPYGAGLGDGSLDASEVASLKVPSPFAGGGAFASAYEPFEAMKAAETFTQQAERLGAREGAAPEGAPTNMSRDSDKMIPPSIPMPDGSTMVVERQQGGGLRTTRGPGPKSEGSTMPSMTEDEEDDDDTYTEPSTVAGRTYSDGTSTARSVSTPLPSLPWSDWQVDPKDVEFCKKEDGSEWKLGAGAYGTVYKAMLDGVQEVAVKVFHDVQSKALEADILREVAILKACRDRNIVQFYGACHSPEDGRIMIITEFMEAGDLWGALSRFRPTGILSWYKRGRRIALEIARGLGHLHARRIVHFDLKSANVLLTRDGTAKVADVGFANILSRTQVTYQQAYTFAWAAPEVLLGSHCTSKADMYSYGVTLWEIATGEQPKRGQLRACKVPEEVPREVEDLIKRCLDVDPAVRPTCKQVVEILSALQSQAPPPNAGYASPLSSGGARPSGDVPRSGGSQPPAEQP